MTPIERPSLHVLLQGESGAGKDTFAATCPSPRMVWHLDGHGQEMPYIDNALLGRAKEVGELKTYGLGGYSITYRDVVDAVGGFTRIEYYSSSDPIHPVAVDALETRAQMFGQEQVAWKTLICGSLSSLAVESRYRDQFVLNPHFKEPRKWYGAATESVERMIFAQKAFSCNTVFICHIARDKNEVGGEFLFGPDLPGRLAYSAGRYFNEMYRLYIYRDLEKKVTHRVLQTDGDGQYQCKTHVKAPNPCWPTYESLWQNWK